MNETDNKIQRIKSMYNGCAKNFNQYLSDHDMAAYNKRSEDLVIEYDRQDDIVDLLLWFSQRVQVLHDEFKMRNL